MSYVEIGELAAAWEEGLTLGRQRHAIPADVLARWRAKGRKLEEMLVGGHQLGGVLRPLPHRQEEIPLEGVVRKELARSIALARKAEEIYIEQRAAEQWEPLGLPFDDSQGRTTHNEEGKDAEADGR